MNPIAVVTWIDGNSRERVNNCHEYYEMEQLITRLREGNRVYFVCMMSVNHPLPVKRVKKHKNVI